MNQPINEQLLLRALKGIRLSAADKAAHRQALYAEMNDRAAKLGMTHGELSWTLEDNAPVNVGIKAMGAKIYKTYRVYEKAL